MLLLLQSYLEFCMPFYKLCVPYFQESCLINPGEFVANMEKKIYMLNVHGRSGKYTSNIFLLVSI